MAKSRGRKFAEITTPTNGVFDIASVPTITNAKLQNSAMTLAGSSVSLGGTGVADTDALSEGSSNVYFTDARVQTFLGGGTLAGNIVVPDNRSIYLGSSSDFRMVHNTTNTQLINATGALQITSNGGFDVTGAASFSAAVTADRFLQSGGSANNLYAIQLSRSGSGTSSPDVHGTSSTLVLGTDASTPIIALTSAGAAVTGALQSTLEISNIGTSGSTSNRLKLAYDSTNGNALIGPDSNGGSTTLALGTSNSGTYANALTIANDGNVTFAGAITTAAISTFSGGSTDYAAVFSSTDAYSGIRFTDPDGSGNVFYRGATDHLYLHSSTFAVAGQTIASGFEFQVNGDSKFTGNALIGGQLNTSGLVGIGLTTTPSQALHVESGNILINFPDGGGSPANTAELQMFGYEGRGVGIRMRDSVNSASNASNREWFVGTGYGHGTFGIYYAADGNQSSYTAQNKFSITSAGHATFTGTGGTRLKVTNTDTNWAALDIQSKGNQANYIFFRDDSAERARIQISDGNDFIFSTGSSPGQRMMIKDAGFVGIGSGIGANPATMLDIESNAADWTSRIKNYNSGAYGLSIDLSGSTSSAVYGLAVYTPAMDGFFVRKTGQVQIGSSATPEAMFSVNRTGATSTGPSSISANTIATFRATGSNSHIAAISVIGGSTANSRVNFGDRDDEDVGFIDYDHNSNQFRFTLGGARRMRIMSNGGLMFNSENSTDGVGYIMGSVARYSTNGRRYLHVQISTAANSMFHVQAYGYVYAFQGLVEAKFGGYMYNNANQTTLYDRRMSGAAHNVYINTSNSYAELVIDQTTTASSNTWGSFTFYGGQDQIITPIPIQIVQYAFSTTGTRQFT